MNGELSVRVQGVALLGPGLDGWDLAAPRLAEPTLWQRAPTAAPAPTLLPATERRRAGLVVKASVAVAEAACQAAGIAPAAPATVFASSTGDPLVCHQLCEALATAERLVSPTRFTNSVHNVAAGYWHIATHSMQASTSLGAFDASAGAGLLEAAAQVVHGGQPVLLVACDVPYPEPLHQVRPIADTVAVALLLAPADSPAGRRLTLTLAGDAAPTPCPDAGLEALRTQVPAARLLPLLALLATPAAGACVIEGLPGAALALQVHAA